MLIVRLLQALGALVLPLLALWRGLRGRLAPFEVAERLGGRSLSGPHLWIHGASVGELTSVRWLVERLQAAHPGLRIVVTANSATGRALAAGWALPGVTARLAPLDLPIVTGRFLAGWQVTGLIVVENELWPERLTALHRRGRPVVVVGARLTERSARGWARFPGVARRLMGCIALLSAQDAGSEARFVALGLPPGRLAPRCVLKAVTEAEVLPPPFPPPAPRARTLLAASTHEGEDAPVLDAFAQARDRFDLLILAPRHPERAEAIAALIADRGLTAARRSLGEVPDRRTDVFLADTLGEMGHWYDMAGACFVGGSLVARGGHTPYEPAAHGCAILHGPDVSNFTESYAALGDAALRVTDAATLAKALNSLPPERQAELGRAAQAALATDDGAGALLPRVEAALGLS